MRKARSGHRGKSSIMTNAHAAGETLMRDIDSEAARLRRIQRAAREAAKAERLKPRRWIDRSLPPGDRD